jgi:hypothetical protein
MEELAPRRVIRLVEDGLRICLPDARKDSLDAAVEADVIYIFEETIPLTDDCQEGFQGNRVSH